MGVIIEKVLTKDYRFNTAYQKAIEDKKVEEQRGEGKKIVLLPVSEGGMNLKTTDINQLINTIGLKKLSE